MQLLAHTKIKIRWTSAITRLYLLYSCCFILWTHCATFSPNFNKKRPFWQALLHMFLFPFQAFRAYMYSVCVFFLNEPHRWNSSRYDFTGKSETWEKHRLTLPPAGCTAITYNVFFDWKNTFFKKKWREKDLMHVCMSDLHASVISGISTFARTEIECIQNSQISPYS